MGIYLILTDRFPHRSPVSPTAHRQLSYKLAMHKLRLLRNVHSALSVSQAPRSKARLGHCGTGVYITTWGA